jgi:hypothetical protein
VERPDRRLCRFSETLPGQSGTRNTLHRDGIFDIDAGVGKTFLMPYSEHHRLQIRAEAFNLTNSVRFDPTTIQGSLINQSTLRQTDPDADTATTDSVRRAIHLVSGSKP